MTTFQIDRLLLPKRYEVLEREAEERQADLGQIVYRVDAAAARVEVLLGQVRDGGVGRFELFLGTSGSGKTTFLKTLPRFFQDVRVKEISPTTELCNVADQIRAAHVPGASSPIWVLNDRDNPNVEAAETKDFFESLRMLFREEAGRVVVVWPITDRAAAEGLREAAWDVGRDSVVDLAGGLYQFEGLPKEQFYEVADTTTRSLNGGQSLEAFGLNRATVEPFAADSATISEFYTRLEKKSGEINGYYKGLLKDKPIPRVWILVAGDDSRSIDLTIATLTQGIERRVDIDRLCEFLDNPNLDAAYLKAWKKRRDQVAYVMRLLDVRIFELPPNTSLPVVRAFGDDALRQKLKLSTVREGSALDAFVNARFYRKLCDADAGRAAHSRPSSEESAHEYLRIQKDASKNDKPLNRALATAVQAALKRDGINATVAAETKGGESNLRPDVLVLIEGQAPVCLEPTWRTTGQEVPGEVDQKQSSLTVGHIQTYVLEKVMGYVDDLGL